VPQEEPVVLLQILIITEVEDNIQTMNWINLDSITLLDKIAQQSFSKAQLLFKHSTRCSISTVAKGRLDNSNLDSDFDCYYLDLIAHRDISAAIAEKFSVHHESPQVILIKNGACFYDESHNGIRVDEILEALAETN